MQIVATRTISDGFNCLGAGSKLRRKLELVQIKTYTLILRERVYK